MHAQHLAGRTALVSGVARPPGIGRATALRLARAGAHVACVEFVGAGTDTGTAPRGLFDRVIAEVEESGPGAVLAYPLTEPVDWDAVVDAVRHRFGGLDICCALNGATGPDAGDGPLVRLGEAAWKRCLDLNLTASVQLMTAAARALVEQDRGGTIVALSSHAARAPSLGVGAVGAARAALQHVVTVLAQEIAPQHIRCNAVSPLAVAPTELFPNPGLVAYAERRAASLDAWLSEAVPLGRAQEADETAAAVEFLCSDAASFISGVILPVAGGAV